MDRPGRPEGCRQACADRQVSSAGSLQELLQRCSLAAGQTKCKSDCAEIVQTSLLIPLVANYHEVAGVILSLLPLRDITALSKVCRDVRAAIKLQPEHPWLACAHGLPSQHPLLQAPCVRAVLEQQRCVHSNFNTDRFAGNVSVPWGKVSLACRLHLVHQPAVLSQCTHCRYRQTAARW